MGLEDRVKNDLNILGIIFIYKHFIICKHFQSIIINNNNVLL